MGKLTRFSVSLDSALLESFDRYVEREGYPTRSKAVADLISGVLVSRSWLNERTIAAAIILVYDHHKRNLSARLTQLQHDHHSEIVSSQHIHLDHDNCLEIIVVRGDPKRLNQLAKELKTQKGVSYCNFVAATTGGN